MYTSYFAKIKDLPENIVPIAICLWPPKWYNGITYKKLAPNYDLLTDYKNNKDVRNYEKRFYEQTLNRLNAADAVFELMELSGGKDFCLICFEKPTEFCHRHLVGKWFNENGFQCEEF